MFNTRSEERREPERSCLCSGKGGPPSRANPTIRSSPPRASRTGCVASRSLPVCSGAPRFCATHTTLCSYLEWIARCVACAAEKAYVIAKSSPSNKPLADTHIAAYVYLLRTLLGRRERAPAYPMCLRPQISAP
jgi:hypothetical protein